jgi:uncharacterized Zn finger protein
MPNASAERRRLSAVIALATKVELVSAADTVRVYACPSESREDFYVVTLRDGERPHCTCLGGEYGRVCKHMGATLLAREYWRLAARRQPVVLRAERCRRRLTRKVAA